MLYLRLLLLFAIVSCFVSCSADQAKKYDSSVIPASRTLFEQSNERMFADLRAELLADGLSDEDVQFILDAAVAPEEGGTKSTPTHETIDVYCAKSFLALEDARFASAVKSTLVATIAKVYARYEAVARYHLFTRSMATAIAQMNSGSAGIKIEYLHSALDGLAEGSALRAISKSDSAGLIKAAYQEGLKGLALLDISGDELVAQHYRLQDAFYENFYQANPYTSISRDEYQAIVVDGKQLIYLELGLGLDEISEIDRTIAYLGETSDTLPPKLYNISPADDQPKRSATVQFQCHDFDHQGNCQMRTAISHEATHVFTNESYGTSASETKTVAGLHGRYYLHLQAKDSVGNIAQNFTYVTLDNLAPLISSFVVESGQTFTPDVTVDLAYTLAQSSDLAGVCLKINSDVSSDCSWSRGPLQQATLAASNGISIFRLWTKDALGNISSDPSQDTLWYDRSLAIQLNNGDNLTKSRNLSVTLTAATATDFLLREGLAACEGAQIFTAIQESTSFMVTAGDGVKEVCAKFKNGAHTSGCYCDTIRLDATAPFVSSVTSDTEDGLYGIGSMIDITVHLSEDATLDTSEGTPLLKLNSHESAVANYESGSGALEDPLHFSYVVLEGDATEDLSTISGPALQWQGATLMDSAGNLFTNQFPPASEPYSLAGQRALVVDGIRPLIVNVTSPQSDATYDTGAEITLVVEWSEPIEYEAAGTPALSLNMAGALATFSSTTQTQLLFTYVPQTGDFTSDLDYSGSDALGMDGGTIRDSAGNESAVLTLPTPGETGSLGANKNIAIDAVGY